MDVSEGKATREKKTLPREGKKGRGLIPQKIKDSEHPETNGDFIMQHEKTDKNRLAGAEESMFEGAEPSDRKDRNLEKAVCQIRWLGEGNSR